MTTEQRTALWIAALRQMPNNRQPASAGVGEKVINRPVDNTSATRRGNNE